MMRERKEKNPVLALVNRKMCLGLALIHVV